VQEQVTFIRKQWVKFPFFNVLLTVHLSINLGNDQLDTHLLYFTVRLL